MQRSTLEFFPSASGNCARRMDPRVRGAAGLLVRAALCASLQQSPPLNADKPCLLPEANRPFDANDRTTMRRPQVKRANFEAANAEPERQLDAGSALLLKLAAELKAHIDQTSRDTHSLSVVRRAGEIQRLAHNVQAKMKLTVGAG